MHKCGFLPRPNQFSPNTKSSCVSLLWSITSENHRPLQGSHQEPRSQVTVTNLYLSNGQPPLSQMTSTTRRTAEDPVDRPSKRHKQGADKVQGEPTAVDRANPYLAHMFDNSEPTQDGNGGSHGRSMMGNFVRHQTTAKMAHAAEDGPLNHFNGKPLSQKYFDILKLRRNLPVHLQR